jgi:hypothetical protein
VRQLEDAILEAKAEKGDNRRIVKHRPLWIRHPSATAPSLRRPCRQLFLRHAGGEALGLHLDTLARCDGNLG